jgi:hypothetical protein
MPFDIELRPAERTVYTRVSGALTDAELLGHMARIAALFRDGTLDGDWAQIVDFTQVEHVDGISSAGVRRAAEGHPWPQYAVRGFVVSTDEQFGLARMYQSLGDPKTADLCLTRSPAEAREIVARERVRLGIGT